MAFTAYATDAIYPASSSTVLFENVVTNLGNAYDPSTGVFTCPTTGTYMFHASVTSPSGSTFMGEVYMGDVYMISLISNVEDTRPSVNMMATQCKVGEFN